MKIGDVIFFNWDGSYSKLIRLFNRLKYGTYGWTHCGIISEKNGDNYVICEALYNGFNKGEYKGSWLRNRINDGDIVIKSPNKRLTNLKNVVDQYIGRPYAIRDAFAVILSLIGLNIRTTGANKLLCSEAVARSLYDASKGRIDISTELNKGFDIITPMDLYLSKHLNGKK